MYRNFVVTNLYCSLQIISSESETVTADLNESVANEPVNATVQTSLYSEKTVEIEILEPVTAEEELNESVQAAIEYEKTVMKPSASLSIVKKTKFNIPPYQLTHNTLFRLWKDKIISELTQLDLLQVVESTGMNMSEFRPEEVARHQKIARMVIVVFKTNEN